MAIYRVSLNTEQLEFLLQKAKQYSRIAEQMWEEIEEELEVAKDNYEPPDDPIAWSGGFAENH